MMNFITLLLTALIKTPDIIKLIKDGINKIYFNYWGYKENKKVDDAITKALAEDKDV